MIDLGINGRLNLENLIATRLLINANSGGGKSWAIRRLLEQSHGQVQQILIDLEGEFTTLREKFDYLLVGKDGEIPANIRTAELLAKKLLELNVSAIIDLSELQHPQRITFVKRFLDGLINLPKNLWHPCLIVIDEAHQFCPEHAKSESTSAVIDLATRGRKRGYCAVLATQRISKLNKDAVAELNNYMIGRTGLDIDMKRASEVLGFTRKEDMYSLRDLKAGEFYTFGSAFTHSGIEKTSIGSIQTTHADRTKGVEITEPSKTPENIKKILKDLIDLPQEAEKELKNTEDMKREIQNLRTKLTIAERSKPEIKMDDAMIEKIKLQSYEAALRKADKNYSEYQKAVERTLRRFEENLKKTVEEGTKLLSSLNIPTVQKMEKDTIKPIQLVQPVRKVSPRNNITITSVVTADGRPLGRCPRMIYSFLYNYPDRTFNSSQIGAVTGYSATSGGFNNALSQLRSMGLIRGNSDGFQVNEMNESIVLEQTFQKENILNILGKCEKEIYEVLLRNPYSPFTKEALAVSTPSNYSPTSGGFSNALSRLATLGLLKKIDGNIQLNPELLEIE